MLRRTLARWLLPLLIGLGLLAGAVVALTNQAWASSTNGLTRTHVNFGLATRGSDTIASASVGSLTSPPADATLTGAFSAVFTPATGSNVTGVSFYCANYLGQGADQLDGTWRLTANTSTCPNGSQSITAMVTYLDAVGSSQSFTPASVPVTVDNPVSLSGYCYYSCYGDQTFTPNGDGQGDTAHIIASVSRAAQVDLVIHDSTGAVVKTFHTDTSYNSGCCIDDTWDGTTDAGTPAPDGAYTADYTATDSDGHVATLTYHLTLDTAAVGSITSPTAQEKLTAAFSAVFTPAAGRNIQSVTFYCGNYLGGGTAQPDGSWELDTNVSGCPAGDQSITAYVSYLDKDGVATNYSTSVPVTVDNPVSLSGYCYYSCYGDQTFTPNGDGQGDTAHIIASVSRAAQVDLVIHDSTGAVVKTFHTDTSYNSGCCIDDTWDGTTDAGTPAPDGAYTADYTATDSDGHVATLTYHLTLDTAAVGSITSPTAQEKLTAAFSAVFTPAAGRNIQSVTFYCGNYLGGGTAQPDGSWELDTNVSGCPAGDQSITAYVSYLDKDGVATNYSTSVPVTVDNPVSLSGYCYYSCYGDQTFTPNGDGQGDTAHIIASVSRAAQVDLVIHDSTGAVVKTFHTDTSYNSGCCIDDTWDGTTDAGTPAPDGAYTADYTATDSDGHVATLTYHLTLDTAAVGSITSPTAQEKLTAAFSAVFTPAAGRNIQSVTFYCGNYLGGGTAQPDGSWELDTNVSGCPAGDQSITAYVSYLDKDGVATNYSTSVPVTVDNPVSLSGYCYYSCYGDQTFTPNGDGQGDTAHIIASVSRAAQVDLVIHDSTGAVVKTFHTDTSYNSGCCIDDTWDGTTDAGTPAPDGAYTADYTATDSDGHVATLTYHLTLDLDGRSPGQLIKPSAGDTLAGFIRFTYAPTPGVAVTRVRIQVCTGTSCQTFTDYAPASDGTWRTSVYAGYLQSGAATVTATADWKDDHGVARTNSDTAVPVTINTTSLPLQQTVSPTSGQRPLPVTVALDTSDPNGADVSYHIDFGDATVADGTVSSPYNEVSLPHTYATPGTYRIVTRVSNVAGALSVRSTTVTVTAPPNTPPVPSLSVDTAMGPAPLSTAFSVGGTDAENDPLTYSLNFGDGSPPTTGALPSATVSHVYASAGAYAATLSVNDGQATTRQTVNVSVAMSAPLTADAGDDQVDTANESLHFSGANSRPTAGIDSYTWAFGDGSVGNGPEVDHSYTAAGTYTATLTVTAAGKTATDSATVTINAPPATPGLAVTVNDSSGNPIPGASAVIIDSSGTKYSATTDSSGKAMITSPPDGAVTVYVYAAGYLPQAVQATVTGGTGSVTVKLTPGNIGATTLSDTRLTYDQIIAAGINVADPANAHVYEADIHLYFDPDEPSTENVVPLYITPTGLQCVGTCAAIGGGGSGGGAGSGGGSGCDVTDPTQPCFLLNGYTYQPSLTYVDGAPIIHWLVLPVRASFLKEFFDVKLIVQNVDPGFTFTHGFATLQLPSGLSLAGTSTPQTPTVGVADVPGGGSQTVTWTIRGDTEGSYDVEADYAGLLDPVGVPITLVAKTSTPIRVYAGSALRMVINVDHHAVRYAPYEVDVAITDVTPDVPVYNFALDMLDRPASAPADEANFFYTPNTDQQQQVAVIQPGETHTFHFVVMPGIGSDDVTKLHVVLAQSFVEKTGGDVDLMPTFGLLDGPGLGPSAGPINVTVVHGDDGDSAKLSWQAVNPPAGQTVTGYQIWTRQALEGGGWKQYGEAAPSSDGQETFSIPSTAREYGRYYDIGVTFSDGTVTDPYQLGVGPDRYVSLGDSFSSGEGVPAFEPGTASDYSPIQTDDFHQYDNTCHRSAEGSYPRIIADAANAQGQLEPSDFYACSDSILRDIEKANPNQAGEAAQLDHVSEFTDLITLTAGINDADFTDVANACTVAICSAATEYQLAQVVGDVYDAVGACKPPLGELDAVKCALAAKTVIKDIPTDPNRVVSPYVVDTGVLKARLHSAYTDLVDQAPNAHIDVLTYPHLFDGNYSGDCHLLGDNLYVLGGAERMTLNHLVDDVNAQLYAAAAEVNNEEGAHHIDVIAAGSALAGGELCQGAHLNTAPSLNSFVGDPLGPFADQGPFSFSFRPNAVGQQQYATAVMNSHTFQNQIADVQQGQTSQPVPVSVPLGAPQLTVVATWPGSTVTMHLTGPSGQQVDGSTPGVTVGSTSRSATITIPHPEPGTWTVTLFGDDVRVGGEPTQVVASAPVAAPLLPTANFTSTPLEGTPGGYTFDATGSSPSTVTYQWTFDDGRTATGPVVQHVFSGPGDYGATLGVTDGDQTTWSDADLETVTTPVITPGLPPDDAQLGTPYTFAFTATGSPQPGFSFTGTLPPGLTLSPAGVLTGTPTEAGTYVFTVIASSQGGIADTGSLTMAVPSTDTGSPTATLGESSVDVALPLAGLLLGIFTIRKRRRKN